MSTDDPELAGQIGRVYEPYAIRSTSSRAVSVSVSLSQPSPIGTPKRQLHEVRDVRIYRDSAGGEISGRDFVICWDLALSRFEVYAQTLEFALEAARVCIDLALDRTLASAGGAFDPHRGGIYR